MKTIRTTFDTDRIVTLMLSRQTRRPVTAPQKHRGRGRRRHEDLPANRHHDKGAHTNPRNRRHKPR